jgi:hypothetical protein
MSGKPAGWHSGFPCRVLESLSGEPDTGLANGISRLSPICQVCRVSTGVDTPAETRVDEVGLAGSTDSAGRLAAEGSYFAEPQGLG